MNSEHWYIKYVAGPITALLMLSAATYGFLKLYPLITLKAVLIAFLAFNVIAVMISDE